jgi:dolichyl-phosphate-mannose--protein O-mannosyl transferase
MAWLISYVPYLSIGIDTHGVEGERYLYLPSMFFCIWLVYVLQQVFQLKKTVLIIGVCCCMGIVFLFQARSYYVKSGKITQQTVQAMQQLTGKEKYFLATYHNITKVQLYLEQG